MVELTRMLIYFHAWLYTIHTNLHTNSDKGGHGQCRSGLCWNQHRIQTGLSGFYLNSNVRKPGGQGISTGDLENNAGNEKSNLNLCWWFVLEVTCSQRELLLPKSFLELVYRDLHEERGHLGVESAHMQNDVEYYMRKVYRCVKYKNLTDQFELVGMDFLHLDLPLQG